MIIVALSEGKSLKSILDDEDANFPNRTTVYTWLNKSSNSYSEDFLNNYTRARKEAADIVAERIMEIAEGTLLKGDEKIDPHAARVAIDALKWAAGKQNPKKYGDKHIQKQEGAVINYNVEVSAEDAKAINDELESDF